MKRLKCLQEGVIVDTAGYITCYLHDVSKCPKESKRCCFGEDCIEEA
jgi:hypothetical protein